MAVIVPDEEVLMSWAKSQNISDSFQELCKSEVRQKLFICRN
jgi:long-subunit acyl-CoA synthetase (AMP-forming)